MNFLLSVPFSTQLNLSTFNAYRNKDTTVSHLQDIICAINSNAVTFHWTLNWHGTQAQELLYKSLDESHIDNAAKAILTLTIDDLTGLGDDVLNIIKSNKPHPTCPADNPKLGTTADAHQPIAPNQMLHASQLQSSQLHIDSCRVHFYDNTIGILSMSVRLDDSIGLHSIDTLSYDICTAALQHLRPLFDDIGAAFINHPYFIKQEGDNNLFIAKRYQAFWVNRTLCVTKDEFDTHYASIDKWSKLYNAEHNTHDFHTFKVLFCVGNNILISPDASIPDVYRNSLNLATYFYCIYFSLNNRVSAIFEDIENKQIFETNFKILYRIERLLLFVDNQNESIVFNLQGDAKKTVNNFFDIWELSKIRDNLNYKTQKVYELYKFERLKKSERLTKIVQGALTIIGASTIVDVMLNIILFSHEDFSHKFTSYGLTKILSSINPDIILLFGFLTLIWFSVIITRDVQKQ